MSTEHPPDRKPRRPLLIAGLALVVIGVAAAALWFFVLRGDTPEELSLDEDRTGTGEVVTDDELSGTWAVVPGPTDEPTVAGYRVDEQFAAGVVEHTAAARTDEVTGTLTVDGRTVTEASIVVDVSTLVSVDDRPDNGRRDNAMRTRGLQTDTFPEASFTLTAPIELPTDIVDGEVFTVAATGELTLHGVAQPITLDLQVRALGDTFAVQGSAPVVFADHDIEPPAVPGFVTAGDEGAFEFLVNLERA